MFKNRLGRRNPLLCNRAEFHPPPKPRQSLSFTSSTNHSYENPEQLQSIALPQQPIHNFISKPEMDFSDASKSPSVPTIPTLSNHFIPSNSSSHNEPSSNTSDQPDLEGFSIIPTKNGFSLVPHTVPTRNICHRSENPTSQHEIIPQKSQPLHIKTSQIEQNSTSSRNSPTNHANWFWSSSSTSDSLFPSRTCDGLPHSFHSIVSQRVNKIQNHPTRVKSSLPVDHNDHSSNYQSSQCQDTHNNQPDDFQWYPARKTSNHFPPLPTNNTVQLPSSTTVLSTTTQSIQPHNDTSTLNNAHSTALSPTSKLSVTSQPFFPRPSIPNLHNSIPCSIPSILISNPSNSNEEDLNKDSQQMLLNKKPSIFSTHRSFTPRSPPRSTSPSITSRCTNIHCPPAQMPPPQFDKLKTTASITPNESVFGPNLQHNPQISSQFTQFGQNINRTSHHENKSFQPFVPTKRCRFIDEQHNYHDISSRHNTSYSCLPQNKTYLNPTTYSHRTDSQSSQNFHISEDIPRPYSRNTTSTSLSKSLAALNRSTNFSPPFLLGRGAPNAPLLHPVTSTVNHINPLNPEPIPNNLTVTDEVVRCDFDTSTKPQCVSTPSVPTAAVAVSTTQSSTITPFTSKIKTSLLNNLTNCETLSSCSTDDDVEANKPRNSTCNCNDAFPEDSNHEICLDDDDYDFMSDANENDTIPPAQYQNVEDLETLDQNHDENNSIDQTTENQSDCFIEKSSSTSSPLPTKRQTNHTFTHPHHHIFHHLHHNLYQLHNTSPISPIPVDRTLPSSNLPPIPPEFPHNLIKKQKKNIFRLKNRNLKINSLDSIHEDHDDNDDEVQLPCPKTTPIVLNATIIETESALLNKNINTINTLPNSSDSTDPAFQSKDQTPPIPKVFHKLSSNFVFEVCEQCGCFDNKNCYCVEFTDSTTQFGLLSAFDVPPDLISRHTETNCDKPDVTCKRRYFLAQQPNIINDTHDVGENPSRSSTTGLVSSQEIDENIKSVDEDPNNDSFPDYFRDDCDHLYDNLYLACDQPEEVHAAVLSSNPVAIPLSPSTDLLLPENSQNPIPLTSNSALSHFPTDIQGGTTVHPETETNPPRQQHKSKPSSKSGLSHTVTQAVEPPVVSSTCSQMICNSSTPNIDSNHPKTPNQLDEKKVAKTKSHQKRQNTITEPSIPPTSQSTINLDIRTTASETSIDIENNQGINANIVFSNDENGLTITKAIISSDPANSSNIVFNINADNSVSVVIQQPNFNFTSTIMIPSQSPSSTSSQIASISSSISKPVDHNTQSHTSSHQPTSHKINPVESNDESTTTALNDENNQQNDWFHTLYEQLEKMSSSSPSKPPCSKPTSSSSSSSTTSKPPHRKRISSIKPYNKHMLIQNEFNPYSPITGNYKPIDDEVLQYYSNPYHEFHNFYENTSQNTHLLDTHSCSEASTSAHSSQVDDLNDLAVLKKDNHIVIDCHESSLNPHHLSLLINTQKNNSINNFDPFSPSSNHSLIQRHSYAEGCDCTHCLDLLYGFTTDDEDDDFEMGQKFTKTHDNLVFNEPVFNDDTIFTNGYNIDGNMYHQGLTTSFHHETHQPAQQFDSLNTLGNLLYSPSNEPPSRHQHKFQHQNFNNIQHDHPNQNKPCPMPPLPIPVDFFPFEFSDTDTDSDTDDVTVPHINDHDDSSDFDHLFNESSAKSPSAASNSASSQTPQPCKNCDDNNNETNEPNWGLWGEDDDDVQYSNHHNFHHFQPNPCQNYDAVNQDDDFWTELFQSGVSCDENINKPPKSGLETMKSNFDANQLTISSDSSDIDACSDTSSEYDFEYPGDSINNDDVTVYDHKSQPKQKLCSNWQQSPEISNDDSDIDESTSIDLNTSEFRHQNIFHNYKYNNNNFSPISSTSSNENLPQLQSRVDPNFSAKISQRIAKNKQARDIFSGIRYFSPSFDFSINSDSDSSNTENSQDIGLMKDTLDFFHCVSTQQQQQEQEQPQVEEKKTQFEQIASENEKESENLVRTTSFLDFRDNDLSNPLKNQFLKCVLDYSKDSKLIQDLHTFINSTHCSKTTIADESLENEPVRFEQNFENQHPIETIQSIEKTIENSSPKHPVDVAEKTDPVPQIPPQPLPQPPRPTSLLSESPLSDLVNLFFEEVLGIQSILSQLSAPPPPPPQPQQQSSTSTPLPIEASLTDSERIVQEIELDGKQQLNPIESSQKFIQDGINFASLSQFFINQLDINNTTASSTPENESNKSNISNNDNVASTTTLPEVPLSEQLADESSAQIETLQPQLINSSSSTTVPTFDSITPYPSFAQIMKHSLQTLYSVVNNENSICPHHHQHPQQTETVIQTELDHNIADQALPCQCQSGDYSTTFSSSIPHFDEHEEQWLEMCLGDEMMRCIDLSDVVDDIHSQHSSPRQSTPSEYSIMDEPMNDLEINNLDDEIVQIPHFDSPVSRHSSPYSPIYHDTNNESHNHRLNQFNLFVDNLSQLTQSEILQQQQQEQHQQQSIQDDTCLPLHQNNQHNHQHQHHNHHEYSQFGLRHLLQNQNITHCISNDTNHPTNFQMNVVDHTQNDRHKVGVDEHEHTVTNFSAFISSSASPNHFNLKIRPDQSLPDYFSQQSDDSCEIDFISFSSVSPHPESAPQSPQLTQLTQSRHVSFKNPLNICNQDNNSAFVPTYLEEVETIQTSQHEGLSPFSSPPQQSEIKVYATPSYTYSQLFHSPNQYNNNNFESNNPSTNPIEEPNYDTKLLRQLSPFDSQYQKTLNLNLEDEKSGYQHQNQFTPLKPSRPLIIPSTPKKSPRYLILPSTSTSPPPPFQLEEQISSIFSPRQPSTPHALYSPHFNSLFRTLQLCPLAPAIPNIHQQPLQQSIPPPTDPVEQHITNPLTFDSIEHPSQQALFNFFAHHDQLLGFEQENFDLDQQHRESTTSIAASQPVIITHNDIESDDDDHTPTPLETQTEAAEITDIPQKIENTPSALPNLSPISFTRDIVYSPTSSSSSQDIQMMPTENIDINTEHQTNNSSLSSPTHTSPASSFTLIDETDWHFFDDVDDDVAIPAKPLHPAPSTEQQIKETKTSIIGDSKYPDTVPICSNWSIDLEPTPQQTQLFHNSDELTQQQPLQQSLPNLDPVQTPSISEFDPFDTLHISPSTNTSLQTSQNQNSTPSSSLHQQPAQQQVPTFLEMCTSSETPSVPEQTQPADTSSSLSTLLEHLFAQNERLNTTRDGICARIVKEAEEQNHSNHIKYQNNNTNNKTKLELLQHNLVGIDKLINQTQQLISEILESESESQ